MPLVSIIVLTLNSERYIGRCLRSIARQTIQDFEAIIVDAGSIDGTERIVREFDQRFRWAVLPRSDMGAARNYGVRLSGGKFVTFLDSDDLYLERKLEVQMRELEQHANLDVTFCDAWHFRTAQPQCMGLKRQNAEPNLGRFLGGFNYNLNTLFSRRSVWENGTQFGEGERGRYGEEWLLQLSMAIRGLSMSHIPEPLVVVEMRPDSHTLWSRQWKMKRQAVDEAERVAGMLSQEQRERTDVAGIVDRLRQKLVWAYLVDGNASAALDSAASVQETGPRRLLRALAHIARVLPPAWVAAGLRRGWIYRQDRTFEWVRSPREIDAQMREFFVETAPGSRGPKLNQPTLQSQ